MVETNKQYKIYNNKISNPLRPSIKLFPLTIITIQNVKNKNFNICMFKI